MRSWWFVFLALAGICARGQEHVVTWNAAEAFSEAGLLESYGSIDGHIWHLGDCVTLTFSRGASDREPQNVFTPQACAWMCFGSEMSVKCIGRYELQQVRITTLPDLPFVLGEVRASVGEVACPGTSAIWAAGHGVCEVTISQPGPYETIHSAGGRVAVTSVEVTYWLWQSSVEEVEQPQKQRIIHDLTGRCVYRPGRGLYVIDGKLTKL